MSSKWMFFEVLEARPCGASDLLSAAAWQHLYRLWFPRNNDCQPQLHTEITRRLQGAWMLGTN